MKRFGQFLDEGECVDEAASMMKVIGAKTVHRKKYKKALDFIKKKLKTVENLGATKVFRVSKIVDKYSLPIDAKVAYELLQKESVNAKLAREKIQREKQADKEKHDRMMDQARRRDTRIKNAMEAAQDPDIKDREGTQPAAYHKGLKKTTKAKRDAHFKKHGKKDDDDASAYKDAPGDKKARKGDVPKSKYTKFVDNMMKEGTDFAAHRAKPKLTDSDQKKMAKVADMLRKEREQKAAMKNEAMGDAAHKAAVKHITDLGKKNNMSVGQQRMHIDNFPQKHDAKTRAAAKTINKNQFGGWKVGKDGKTTQKEEVEQVEEGIEYHAHGKVFKKKGEAIAHHVKKLGNKANYNHEVHRVDTKTNTITHGFDGEGRSKHLGFNKAKYDKLSAGKPIGEEVEQIDELTKKTIQRYQDQAALHHRDAKLAGATEIQKRREKGYDLSDKKLSGKAKVKATGKLSDYPYRKEEVIQENSFAEKSEKSGISVATLKKVYNRGVAAWKTGHRPGTTPQQWGHSRVNAFITKKKKGGLNHDKDLA